MITQISRIFMITSVLTVVLAISIMMLSLRRFLKGNFKDFLQWLVSTIIFMSGAYIFYIYTQIINLGLSSANLEIIQLTISSFMILSSITLIKMSMKLDILSKEFGLARFSEFFNKKSKKKRKKK